MRERQRVIATGLQPGCIIAFNEIHRRLGMCKNTCASWKYNEHKNPEGIRVYRENSTKEFCFTDDVIEFLRRRWTQNSRSDQ